jgi:ABC-type lipoprotein release transport system permease subunit
MSTAIVVFLVVLAVVAGTIVTLRTTTRQGLPPKDVMDRARQRAREQNARDEAEQRRN